MGGGDFGWKKKHPEEREKKLLLVYVSLLDPKPSVKQLGSSTHTFQCILCLNRDTGRTGGQQVHGLMGRQGDGNTWGPGGSAGAKPGAQAPRADLCWVEGGTAGKVTQKL